MCIPCVMYCIVLPVLHSLAFATDVQTNVFLQVFRLHVLLEQVLFRCFYSSLKVVARKNMCV